MDELDDDLSGRWVFDPAHTRIGFYARHAMITKVRGAFNDVDGRVVVDARRSTDSFVVVRLRTASVDTRNAERDAHLRSADFFDAARYPEIVFRSMALDRVAERSWLVVGDLTIRGITRQLSVPVALTGLSHASGELRAGFEGMKRVDRRDWGLRWQRILDDGGLLVSEKVVIELEISAVKVHGEGPVADPAGPATAVGSRGRGRFLRRW